jgi:mono/diheme cytochrome c family protein
MRHLARSFMIGALILATACPANAQEASAVLAGAEVAKDWCSGCHAVDPRQALGTDIAPSLAAIAAMPATTAMSLHAFLTTPHERMPDLKLSSTDIDNVVAYILSLRRR